jgi:hypothetical protein
MIIIPYPFIYSLLFEADANEMDTQLIQKQNHTPLLMCHGLNDGVVLVSISEHFSYSLVI